MIQRENPALENEKHIFFSVACLALLNPLHISKNDSNNPIENSVEVKPGLWCWQTPPPSQRRRPRIGGIERRPFAHQIRVHHPLSLLILLGIIGRGGGRVAVRPGGLCPIGGVAATDRLRQIRIIIDDVCGAAAILCVVAGCVVQRGGREGKVLRRSVSPAARSRRLRLPPRI